MTDSAPPQIEQSDEELVAYHEAGHAVAMWRLGLGVKTVSIEPRDGLAGHAQPAFAYDDPPRLYRPSAGLGQASTDHRDVHRWMYRVEDSGTIQITWCNHLWQRA